MTEKENMLGGKLYNPYDAQLINEAFQAKKILHEYNSLSPCEQEKKDFLIKSLFGKTGTNILVVPPFYCDYGINIIVGEDFYANFDCIILDVCEVRIGHHVFFGPRVSIYTATHPIDAHVRNLQLEFGKKVHIGNNVWIGGNTVVNPGVTIGDNSIIGSGSVVVKDIPPNVIAVGNPCKILRKITEKDKHYWGQKADEYYQSN